MTIRPNSTCAPVAPPFPAVGPTAPRRPRSVVWAVVLGMVIASSSWWGWDRFVRPSAFGLVEVERLTIASPADGLIESMPVTLDNSYPGQQVAFSISDRNIQDQLARLQLELIIVESHIKERSATVQFKNDDRLYERDRRLAELRAELGEARLELGRLSADIHRTNATLAVARYNVQRIESLGLSGSAAAHELVESQAEFDGLEKKLGSLLKAQEAAEARVDARLDAIRRPVPDVPQLANMVEPLNRQADLIRLQIRQLQTELATMEVRLPSPGVVSDIMHRPGELIRKGEPVITIDQPSTQQVVAYFEQRYADDIVAGMPVRISSSYAPDMRGRVLSTGPYLKMGPAAVAQRHPDKTPLLPVVIQIDDLGKKCLVPGSIVRVYPAARM